MKVRGIAVCFALVALLIGSGAAGLRWRFDARADQPPAAGVLGQPRDEWDQAFGSAREMPDYVAYDVQDSGTFNVEFDGDLTTFFEWVVPGNPVSFTDAETFAEEQLLPGDAELIEEYAEASVDAADRATVQLYQSDSITGLFGRGTGSTGFILAVYGRDGSGDTVKRVSVSVGRER